MRLFGGLLMIIFAFQGVAKEPETLRCDELNDSPGIIDRAAEALGKTKEKGQTKAISLAIRGEETKVNYTRYPAKKQPSRGVIVSLCGGPGYSCTQMGRSPAEPSDYDMVTLDYLGIGANAGVKLPEKMSIEAQAEAVAGIVRSLPDSQVVLVGRSFGTTVATVAASQLTHGEDAGAARQKLKGVMLEGVVGLPGRSVYGEGHLQTADATWLQLSRREKDMFTKSFKAAAKVGGSEGELMISEYLTQELVRGPLPMADTLRRLGQMDAKELLRFVEKEKQRAEKENSKEGARQYRAAGCQIGGPSGAVKPKKMFAGLVAMTFAAADGAIPECKCRTVARDYDPSQFQIKGIPVLYINGEKDAATPVAWARTHEQSQLEASQKVFLSLPMGGHFETLGYGPISSCMSPIYDALFSQDISKLSGRQRQLTATGCRVSGRETESSGRD